MKEVWQRFLRLVGDDPEVTGMSLLVAAFAVTISAGLLVYCLATGRYLAVAGVAVGLAGVISVCIRDYRRGRWSFVSGLVVAVWLLLSCAALAYECWVSYGRG
jgi:hypothetical protein